MNRSRLTSLVVALLLLVLLAACAVPLGGNTTPAAATPAAAATLPVMEDTPAADSAPSPRSTPAADAPPGLTMSWPNPPAMTIDPTKMYLATFKTAQGDFVVQLYPEKAPNTVNNFVFLAKEGYYDNTTFHRVLEGFMAQGGDPSGTGTGGPGYTFADEISPDAEFDRPGLLAMANSGANTNGSQFFITFAATPWLNGNHTIFGEVVQGQEVLGKLTRRDPDQNPESLGDVLSTIEISETTVSMLPTPTSTPTPFAPDPTADDHFMANMPLAGRVGYWNKPPANILEAGVVYVATFKTEQGDIAVELMPDLAPNNVNNFIALARAGYYDGTHFWQVLQDLVAVGGDPLEEGTGNAGYFVDDEITSNVFNDVGWLGSAQDAPDHNSGQFFFTLAAAPWLAERFTPLGRVVEGQDVLTKLEIRDPNQPTDSPGTLLQRVDISTATASRLPSPTPTPLPLAPTLPKGDERPLSKIDPAQRNNYYNSPPEMAIDLSKDYVAIIRTDLGDITINLFEDQAPETVNNFVILAANGFYDDTSFHRVIEGFMAQAGDPTSTGAGGPGYEFADEFVPELRHDRAGIVSMANRGEATNGSQFFITLDATSWLDDKHTIFGEVVEGMDIVKQIPLRDPDTATEPGLMINRIDIETK